MQGDGPTWIAFTGEIIISDQVKVTGFKAGGLTVKVRPTHSLFGFFDTTPYSHRMQDCLLLSMTPPEPQKSPFTELRQVIPVRLTTDVWTANGTGIGAAAPARSSSEYSVPSSPGDLPDQPNNEAHVHAL